MPEDGASTRGPSVARLGILVAEAEAADAALVACQKRAAAAQIALARGLSESGPFVVGPWRYVGLYHADIGKGIVFREVAPEAEGVPVVASHAAISISDDDGEIEP